MAGRARIYWTRHPTQLTIKPIDKRCVISSTLDLDEGLMKSTSMESRRSSLVILGDGGIKKCGTPRNSPKKNGSKFGLAVALRIYATPDQPHAWQRIIPVVAQGVEYFPDGGLNFWIMRQIVVFYRAGPHH